MAAPNQLLIINYPLFTMSYSRVPYCSVERFQAGQKTLTVIEHWPYLFQSLKICKRVFPFFSEKRSTSDKTAVKQELQYGISEENMFVKTSGDTNLIMCLRKWEKRTNTCNSITKSF